MNRKVFSVVGALVGAGFMYLLDPERGKRRRALIRDKAVRFRHDTTDALNATVKDVRNRSQGLVARARRTFVSQKVSDDTIAHQVREAVQHAVSHPGAIAVHVENGNVMLTGDILDSEVGDLLAEVKRVSHGGSVDNRLQAHDSADQVSALQGASSRASNSAS